jgi:hypothetical protein
MYKSEKFESFLFIDLDVKSLPKCMFFIWDGNRWLQIWLPYINHLHDDEPS